MSSAPPARVWGPPPEIRQPARVLVGARLDTQVLESFGDSADIEVQGDVRVLARRAAEEPAWLLVVDQELWEPFWRCLSQAGLRLARSGPVVFLEHEEIVPAVTSLLKLRLQWQAAGSHRDEAMSQAFLIAALRGIDSVAAGMQANPDEAKDPLSLLVRPRSPEEEKRAKHVALEAAFRERERLLAGSLGTQEVAQLLGVTRQTPHDRVKAGALLAVEDSKGTLRFPMWQFDPEGPAGVVKGLPDVLRALQVGKLAQLRWLERPNPVFENRSPLEALKAGEVERVVHEARSIGATAGNG